MKAVAKSVLNVYILLENIRIQGRTAFKARLQGGRKLHAGGISHPEDSVRAKVPVGLRTELVEVSLLSLFSNMRLMKFKYMCEQINTCIVYQGLLKFCVICVSLVFTTFTLQGLQFYVVTQGG